MKSGRGWNHEHQHHGIEQRPNFFYLVRDAAFWQQEAKSPCPEARGLFEYVAATLSMSSEVVVMGDVRKEERRSRSGEMVTAWCYVVPKAAWPRIWHSGPSNAQCPPP